MKLPYRNKLEHRRVDHFDIVNVPQEVTWKPLGFWYEISFCLLEWGELDFGRNVYEIDLGRNFLGEGGILQIKNIDEFDEFHKKYEVKQDLSIGKGYSMIDWGKVSKKYKGFEIKNYYKIKRELRKREGNIRKYFRKYSWFDSFDFSSGCIWDTSIIKNKKFFRKLTKKEIKDFAK